MAAILDLAHTVSIACLESFRALELSLLESFRVLKLYNPIGNLYGLKVLGDPPRV